MMRTTTVSDQDNIFAALVSRARATPDRTLLSLETGGLALSLAVLGFLPQHSAFALPGIGLAAFGVWGVIDHFIVTNVLIFTTERRIALRILQRAIGALGVVAGLGSVFALFGMGISVFVA